VQIHKMLLLSFSYHHSNRYDELQSLQIYYFNSTDRHPF